MDYQEDNFCDCPMECNSISYSFTTVSTPLDQDELCPDMQNEYSIDRTEDFLMKPFYQNPNPPKFVRKMRHFKNNVSFDVSFNEMAYCKKYLQYKAEVIFKMAKDTIPVTIKSSRLSFFDKMSAFGKLFMLLYCNVYHFHIIGGTLGLFTGISILSMVEVVFWISRFWLKYFVTYCKKELKSGNIP